MSLSGRITEWNRDRGFGYLTCEGRRVFLHIREFKERRKQPEVGDEVIFFLGADKQGRPCAQLAEQVTQALRTRPIEAVPNRRLKAVHFGILLFLFLPGYAVDRLIGPKAVWIAGAWVILISVLTYQAYATDKRQAQNKGWRESEAWLHWLEFLGGWAGAFFAQRKLRHKSSKGTYQFVFVLIIGIHQFLAIDALRGWPFLRLVGRALEKI